MAVSASGRCRRGADLRIGLELSFKEAAFGCQKELTVQRSQACTTCAGSGAKPGTSPQTCRLCHGRGEVVQTQGIFSIRTTCPQCQGAGRTIQDKCVECRGRGQVRVPRTVTVTIPAGVDNDMQMRLGGEGESGQDGASPGDLYVALSVTPHDFFQRDGADLLAEIPISFAQAALGTELAIPMLDGSSEEVTVARGTQSGHVISLRGKGLPRVQTSGSGDLHVRVTVKTPTSLSRQQEELLRKLAEISEEKVTNKGVIREFLDKITS